MIFKNFAVVCGFLTDEGPFAMKSTYLLVLASLAVCNLPLCKGQSLVGFVGEDESDQKTIDDIILQKAESLLLRSILQKMQGEDDRYGA